MRASFSSPVVGVGAPGAPPGEPADRPVGAQVGVVAGVQVAAQARPVGAVVQRGGLGFEQAGDRVAQAEQLPQLGALAVRDREGDALAVGDLREGPVGWCACR